MEGDGQPILEQEKIKPSNKYKAIPTPKIAKYRRPDSQPKPAKIAATKTSKTNAAPFTIQTASG